MTIQERKLTIALQLANGANELLIAQLADRVEEVEQLKAEIEKLKTNAK